MPTFRGELISVETAFQLTVEEADVGGLIDVCDRCGDVLVGADALPGYDDYQQELWNEYVLATYCAECAQEVRDAI